MCIAQNRFEFRVLQCTFAGNGTRCRTYILYVILYVRTVIIRFLSIQCITIYVDRVLFVESFKAEKKKGNYSKTPLRFVWVSPSFWEMGGDLITLYKPIHITLYMCVYTFTYLTYTYIVSTRVPNTQFINTNALNA